MKNKLVFVAATAGVAGVGWHKGKKFLARQIELYGNPRSLLTRAAASIVDGNLIHREADGQRRQQLAKKNAKAITFARIAIRSPLKAEALPDAYGAMDKVTADNYALNTNCNKLARLLTMDCEVRAAEKNWPAALQSALDAQRLGVWMQIGAPIVTMLFGHGIQRLAREQMRQLLPQLDRATLETARKEWQKITIEQLPFAQILRVETAWTQRFYERELTKLPPQLAQRMRTESQHILADEIAEAERPYLKSNQQPRREDETGDAGPEPETAVPTTEMSDVELSELVEQEFASNRALYRNARFGFEKNVVQNAFILAELALRAYELEHGKVATSWDDIVPTYLPQAPADPFDYEHSLRLTTRVGKTVAYSIGPDGLDDKGVPIENPTVQDWQRFRVNVDNRGDIVSGVNVQ